VRLRKETFINLLSKKEEILNKQNSRCKSKLCSEILGKVSCRMINSWESESLAQVGMVGAPSAHLTPTTSTWLFLAFSSRCLQDFSGAPNFRLRRLREWGSSVAIHRTILRKHTAHHAG
jgi:hypothetical protein